MSDEYSGEGGPCTSICSCGYARSACACTRLISPSTSGASGGCAARQARKARRKMASDSMLTCASSTAHAWQSREPVAAWQSPWRHRRTRPVLGAGGGAQGGRQRLGHTQAQAKELTDTLPGSCATGCPSTSCTLDSTNSSMACR
jgi:hypothetical protein